MTRPVPRPAIRGRSSGLRPVAAVLLGTAVLALTGCGGRGLAARSPDGSVGAPAPASSAPVSSAPAAPRAASGPGTAVPVPSGPSGASAGSVDAAVVAGVEAAVSGADAVVASGDASTAQDN